MSKRIGIRKGLVILLAVLLVGVGFASILWSYEHEPTQSPEAGSAGSNEHDVAEGKGSLPVPDESDGGRHAVKRDVEAPVGNGDVRIQGRWAHGSIVDRGTGEPLSGCRFQVRLPENRLDAAEKELIGKTGALGQWEVEVSPIVDALDRLEIVFEPYPNVALSFEVRKADSPVELVAPSLGAITVTCTGGPPNVEWVCTVQPLVLVETPKVAWEPLGSWTKRFDKLGCSASVATVNSWQSSDGVVRIHGLKGQSYSLYVRKPGFKTVPGPTQVVVPVRMDFAVVGQRQDVITIKVLSGTDPRTVADCNGFGWLLWGRHKRRFISMRMGSAILQRPKADIATIILRLESGELFERVINPKVETDVRFAMGEAIPALRVDSDKPISCGVVEKSDGSHYALWRNRYASRKGEGLLKLSQKEYRVQPGSKSWRRIWLIALDGCVATLDPGAMVRRVVFPNCLKREIDVAQLWAFPSFDFTATLVLEICFDQGKEEASWVGFRTIVLHKPRNVILHMAPPALGASYRIRGALKHSAGVSVLATKKIRWR